MSNPYGAYLETKVLSASPLQVVHLAYEAAIEAVGQARLHLSEGRIQERSRSITRAVEFLVELSHGLDFKSGGDLSVQLARLYDYMQRRLCEANIKQIDEPLAEVRNLLQTLDEAWKEIATSDVSAAAAVGSSSASAGSSAWMTAADSSYRRAEYTL
jgi:flagellar secretion chaperone FliS